jgi:hypothetical protein
MAVFIPCLSNLNPSCNGTLARCWFPRGRRAVVSNPAKHIEPFPLNSHHIAILKSSAYYATVKINTFRDPEKGEIWPQFIAGQVKSQFAIGGDANIVIGWPQNMASV